MSELHSSHSVDEYFLQREDRTLVNCCVSLTLHRNAIYTLTTISTAQKGSHSSPPASEPFPFPYETTFSSEKNRFADFAHFFTDQGGMLIRTEENRDLIAHVRTKESFVWLRAHSSKKVRSFCIRAV